MKLSNEFWAAHKGELIVGTNGELAFTEVGRKKYAPIFAKHGYTLALVSTVEIFEHVMDIVTTEQLEATTEKVRNLLSNSAATEEERETIRRVLEISEDRPKRKT